MFMCLQDVTSLLVPNSQGFGVTILCCRQACLPRLHISPAGHVLIRIKRRLSRDRRHTYKHKRKRKMQEGRRRQTQS